MLHAEFKLIKNELVPIEINQLRVGGMGLGHMIFHISGYCPYDGYLYNKMPDIRKFYEKNKNIQYVYFIAYNGTDIDLEMNKPDKRKLLSEFNDVVVETWFDYQTQLALGAFVLKESLDSINDLLSIDFNDYYLPK